jgi:hypothetical protein
MEWRYKLEIELDDEKILADDKYYLEDIYNAIRQMFANEGIPEIKTDSHMLVFASNKRDDKEFARFGFIEKTLISSDWFLTYVKRMTWYDTIYGKVSQEDVLKVARKHGLI